MNGIRLHYVEGGRGEQSLVLVPGWPQTWFVWRKIMPELARSYRVLAVDIRGMGDSERPEVGYDTETLATDINALTEQLGIARYSVVGHDIGMWIAYPLAARYGSRIEKLVVTEALIPGVTPSPPMLMPPVQNALLTQFMFNQLRDLPEFLVAGREEAYLRWIFDHMAYWKDRIAIGEYIRAYSVPGAMKAGFEHYRAIPADIEQNQRLQKTKLTMPVLAIGGSLSARESPIDTMKCVSDNVTGVILDQCGHYTPEERPDEFIGHLKHFLVEQDMKGEVSASS